MIKNELYNCLKKLINDSPKIKQIVLNSGFTGVVLDNSTMGMAMNVRSGCNTNKKIYDFLQRKINSKALPAVVDILNDRDNFSASPDEAYLINSVLVALFNALSKPFMNEEYFKTMGCRVEYNTGKASKAISEDIKSGETVTIVGFGGMVRSLSKTAGKTYVTELNPDLFLPTLISAQGIERGPDCCTIVPSDQGEEYFKKADTIFITGCTLVTDTMDDILKKCSGKNIIVYGTTASFWPQPLLERGVNKIRATNIKDSELMVELLINCAGAAERFFPMASENMVITKNL